MSILGDYIKIKHGYAFKGTGISTEDNGVVLVTPGNFAIGGGFKEDKCKFFTEDYPEEYRLSEDDLIVTMTDLSKDMDTLGYSALVPASDRIYLHNQRIGLVELIRDDVDKHFIHWFMRTYKYQRTIAGSASGTTVHHTSPGRICDVEVAFPSYEMQKKIAYVLDSIEDKIKLNEEVNNNLMEQAVTLYQHFVAAYDWPESSISDIAEKVAMGPFGSNIKVSTFVPSGVPIISGNHLRGYFLEESTFNYITEDHAERLKNSIVHPHDLIFTHAGNIGQVAMIPDECKYQHYVLSQRQFYLRCDESRVMPEFILFFFHSPKGQHELLSYANQTGVPSIAQPATNLKKIQFPLPPFSEQVIWHNQVKPLLDYYLTNIREIEWLTSMRDILLPKLMSGEVDVSNLDF